MPDDDSIVPVPSRVFSARELGELILQMVGVFSLNDAEADPEAMQRTMNWLELNIAELAGTVTNWRLKPPTFRFYWPANTRIGTVAEIMGAVYPATGIIFPLSANLVDANGISNGNLPLVRREHYERAQDKDAQGKPCLLYFDRQAIDPTVSIHRVPEDGTTWQIDLVAQTYAPSVLGEQVNTEQSGNFKHYFSSEWQRFLIYQTAADVGSGPVKRLQRQDVQAWREIAADSLAKLIAWSNREKTSGPRRTRRWGA